MDKPNIHEAKNNPGRRTFLSPAVPLLILTVVTLLAFANAWPNALVLDDKGFAGPQRPQVLDSIVYIFSHDVWAAQDIDSGLYRPLFLLSLSAESRLFGDWLAGYHLSNILQHLLVSLLAYGFLSRLLRNYGEQSDASDLCALLAAVIFAVHPIHTEAVDSVFNRSEIMVALFGLAGLWWVLRFLKTAPVRAWSGLGIAYFFALLSKESAVVIPALAAVFIILPATDSLMTRIRRCLPVLWLLLPLAAYLALRAHALDQPSTPVPAQAPSVAQVAEVLDQVTLPDSSSLLSAAGVLGNSLKVLVWPYPLHMFYQQPSDLESIYLLAVQVLLVVAALVQLARRRYALAFGLAFFYIAMLPASRLFDLSANGPHLAERYLYFPSFGLAIVIAFTLNALARRFSSRVAVNAGLPVLVLLTFLTWDRNSDWKSEIRLYETEYQRGYRGSNIMRLLTSSHSAAKNYARIVKICDENRDNVHLNPDNPYFYFCAVAYEHEHRPKDAEDIYLRQIEVQWIRIDASLALAHFYVRQNRRYDAEKHFLTAVNESKDPAQKAYYMAEMIVSLNPGIRGQAELARDYLREALRLRPGWAEAESMLRGLDRALHPAVPEAPAEDTPNPDLSD